MYYGFTPFYHKKGNIVLKKIKND